jgi:hypothetical protein
VPDPVEHVGRRGNLNASGSGWKTVPARSRRSNTRKNASKQIACAARVEGFVLPSGSSRDLIYGTKHWGTSR